ncbi:MAG: hypothetical protein ACHQVS_00470 [Candidatus Babeliales bacterium]
MKMGVIALCIMSTSLYGYHKFRCMDCLLDNKTSSIQFVATPSFSIAKASYVMVDNRGVTTSYVYLSALDKRAIVKQLRAYNTETPITQDLINACKRPAWRRKQVVGLVLQDFKSMKPTATVGDVLAALQL